MRQFIVVAVSLAAVLVFATATWDVCDTDSSCAELWHSSGDPSIQ